MLKYKVILESNEGKCKHVVVTAYDQYEAMAKAQRAGWYAVGAVPVIYVYPV